MKAIVVCTSFVTRVIVPDDFEHQSDEGFEALVRRTLPKFQQQVREEFDKNIDTVFDDEECPYDPSVDTENLDYLALMTKKEIT